VSVDIDMCGVQIYFEILLVLAEAKLVTKILDIIQNLIIKAKNVNVAVDIFGIKMFFEKILVVLV